MSSFMPLRSLDSSTFESLTALLRHFDWSPTSKEPGRFEVWGRTDGDEVLLPLNPSRPDFERLLRNAEAHIVARFGREATEVLRVLGLRLSGVLDSTQWKKNTKLDAGLIGWEEGEALYIAARSALAAAARSTRENRMYHGNASSHIAKRFIENSFMGQTEIGSFIITAYTPSNTRFHLTRKSEDIAPLNPRKSETVSGRTILNTLVEGLTSVTSALTNYRKDRDLEAFAQRVDDGVSYELLKALAEVSREAESAVIVSRNDAGSESKPVEFAFDPPDSNVLERAALRFAEGADEPRDATLVGEVTLLSHTSGEIVHVIRIDMDGRKVRVRLDAERYKLALDAHGDGKWVLVRGKVEKDGNTFWMNSPTDMSVVEPPKSVEQTEPGLELGV